MKSIVIYYSQSGNTRKVAKAIHKGMRQVAGECDIVQVKDIDPSSINQYDLIGLGSPVWDGGFTPNVRIFMKEVPQQNGRHIFSFNTHGVMPELYFPSVVRKLRIKGFTVIGMRDWYGSVHFQIAPKPYFTDGHPDEVDLREAEEFGKEMVEKSRRIHEGETNLIPPLPKFELTPQLLVLLEFYQSGHNPHGHLHFDPKKCAYPKCRLCEENCLMGYIDLSVDPPKFGSKGNACDMWMGCTFCELICPTGAISCDWDAVMEENARLGQMFGYNPLERAAQEAVAMGRLRKLVTEDIKGPYYKVYSKRPRFKIIKEHQ
ncbi:MAG: flavodoxin domain-containing protein [Deltaproteobacteria bacterium]|nr:flavodoxin domain-containing protein [Deltaproteobacteria bacterium]